MATWTRQERQTRSWNEMSDAQLSDEAYSTIITRLGVTDEKVAKYLMSCGVSLVRAEDAVYYARKALKAQGMNPARLTRSVGSDDYVDGRSKRSTI